MGRLGDATAAIRRALSGKRDVDTVPGPELGSTSAAGAQAHGPVIWDATPVAPGSHAFEVPTQTPFTVEPADIEELLVEPTAAPPAATTPVEARPVDSPAPVSSPRQRTSSRCNRCATNSISRQITRGDDFRWW